MQFIIPMKLPIDEMEDYCLSNSDLCYMLETYFEDPDAIRFRIFDNVHSLLDDYDGKELKTARIVDKDFNPEIGEFYLSVSVDEDFEPTGTFFPTIDVTDDGMLGVVSLDYIEKGGCYAV